jgi:impB/mucB/samB family
LRFTAARWTCRSHPLVDCDAFYATVEKRDRPELADRPVIIGGGTRGVVLACCYVARLYGVRSAMPMFKALAACPDAVVIRPNMAKYREVGREVRAEMRQLTPLVEPLSIDEAFLDLGGTERLHGACTAQLLAALAKRVETALAITVSIGLSDNKIPRKARLRPRQAARFRNSQPPRSARVPRRQAGFAAMGRWRGNAAATCRRRHYADRAASGARRLRALFPLWSDGGTARSSVAWL